MTDKSIEQQIYTRERGGIFLTTDGYDTVAISNGLDKTFVKKYLHPFCIYHAPRALTERGEKDASLYPEAITLFQPETGDLVIGQAVFVPADFTGTRSTYFMHNYIIPKDRKEEWLKEPARLFQLNDFHTSYDIELGNVLPVMEHLSHTEDDVLSVKDELLAKLDIDEEKFKQLLFAVMSSIAGKKKVFISLNVPIQEYSAYALLLLELITIYLPYAHRRKLGALTFTSAPEGKNYIHVMFYEPGTLNINDRSIEKQFIFDLANNRISGVEIARQKHEYLDFALEHLSKSKGVDDFFAFAENVLSGLPEDQKLEVASYYQLTTLYQTLNNQDDSFYKNNKLGFLYSLQKFLQVNSHEKQQLVELFLNILEIEKIASDSATALDYIQTVVSINQIVRSDEALSLILHSLEYYQNENDQLFHKIWNLIEQDRLSHEALLMFIDSHPNYDRLLEQYLEERFKRIIRVEDILEEIKRVLNTPYLLEVGKFKEALIEMVEQTVKQKHNSFDTILAIKEIEVEKAGQNFLELKQKMFGRAVWALLTKIRPNELKTEDLLLFGKIFDQPINPRDMKDGKAKENYLITGALYHLLNKPSQAGTYNLKALSKSARHQLREILVQQLTSIKMTSDHYPVLNIAFGTDHGEIESDLLFQHLIHYSDDRTIMDFIKLNANLVGINASFRSALRSYLVSNPKSIWKNKKYNKELKLIRLSSFKNFLKDVENETASPVVKFFKRYGVKLVMALGILGGTGGAAWFGIDYYLSKNSKTEVASKPVENKQTPKEENLVLPISLNQFKEMAEEKVEGQTFSLLLDGEHFEKIVGQDQAVTLTNHQADIFQLDLTTGLKTSPFDRGALKAGFSLSGTEFDFDSSDETAEVVIVSKNKAGESYLWVFSTSKALHGTTEPLEPVFTAEGISDVTLDGKKLTLLQGEKEVLNEFPFTGQVSDKQ